MNRALAGGSAALFLLAACPLPQPLPEYPAGTVTPPRIHMDSVAYPDTTNLVPSECTGNLPDYPLNAELVDPNTSESISVRWFVDYDRQNSARCAPVTQEVIPGPGDQEPGDPTRREVRTYHFRPYDFPAVVTGTDPLSPGTVHVVDLVVSNSFDPANDDSSLCTPGTAVFPFRTPASSGGVNFETQTYRWVFVNVAPSATVPCP